MQLCSFGSDCKGDENILGSRFVKVFSAFPSHSLLWMQCDMSTVPSVLISIERTSKSQLEPGQESVGDVSVLSHCSFLRIP